MLTGLVGVGWLFILYVNGIRNSPNWVGVSISSSNHGSFPYKDNLQRFAEEKSRGCFYFETVVFLVSILYFYQPPLRNNNVVKTARSSSLCLCICTFNCKLVVFACYFFFFSGSWLVFVVACCVLLPVWLHHWVGRVREGHPISRRCRGMQQLKRATTPANSCLFLEWLLRCSKSLREL